ncbi:DUF5009 domain-containing protein [Reichenbachiella agarivorans]|uniref:DUF5009 domain-containing protein n=1 Tax=Reichenbachiella agarivorans TaxID=2979464 RepID=A0ABY6CP60_9BACT|nr:DUF5009 domain-containing protein [Reichenbachiella agarivorans]UXP32301.1 DUF5009 domain-containing protein [Reichenbachiella agarivorans]
MTNDRLASIDIIRALTMMLMIFVNDLWSLTGIPDWLEHTAAAEDGMGLADVVFPAFLFIVGLSIPHALKARMKKGESKAQIMLHVLSRTFAMVVMGLYMVNMESIDGDQMPISKSYWQILMALAFVLIWNNYKEPKVFKVIPAYTLKIVGWAILIFLAYIYQSASGDWMLIHWWGILGLIGWAYLVCATTYLLIGDQWEWIALTAVVLVLLNVNEFMHWGVLDFNIVVSASNHASVMMGVLVTVIYSKLVAREQVKLVLPVLISLACVLIIFGLLTRPEWGISKIRATPSWTAICAGISTVVFVLLYVLTDLKGITKWAQPIAAAGYSTLTCYLIPYFVYPILTLVGFDLPDVLTTGALGLLKSLLFSVLIIQITALLYRAKISLKI